MRRDRQSDGLSQIKVQLGFGGNLYLVAALNSRKNHAGKQADSCAFAGIPRKRADAGAEASATKSSTSSATGGTFSGAVVDIGGDGDGIAIDDDLGELQSEFGLAEESARGGNLDDLSVGGGALASDNIACSGEIGREGGGKNLTRLRGAGVEGFGNAHEHESANRDADLAWRRRSGGGDLFRWRRDRTKRESGNLRGGVRPGGAIGTEELDSIVVAAHENTVDDLAVGEFQGVGGSEAGQNDGGEKQGCDFSFRVSHGSPGTRCHSPVIGRVAKKSRTLPRTWRKGWCIGAGEYGIVKSTYGANRCGETKSGWVGSFDNTVS